ncbi:hypothetical protein BDZ45DRAFT_57137 [Acephala macrosclerotiorum]|nr:hypothetical protein BDZ45DRAFT_57137 [Acephala macrosclerotiorum]
MLIFTDSAELSLEERWIDDYFLLHKKALSYYLVWTSSLHFWNFLFLTSEMSDQAMYIVSVNMTPEKAKELVAILIKDLSHKYNLVHVANTNAIYGVSSLLESLVVTPHILICSSQWTVEQQSLIQATAKEIVPGIKTIAIPPGLNATKGGEAVVDFLKWDIQRLGLPMRV